MTPEDGLAVSLDREAMTLILVGSASAAILVHVGLDIGEDVNMDKCQFAKALSVFSVVYLPSLNPGNILVIKILCPRECWHRIHGL